MIECRDLVKKYKRTEVISNLSFNVNKGEVFGLLGSNGAGKTTTIKMLLCLTKCTSGIIKIDEGVKIGYSPETPYFHPFLSAYEIMRFFSKLQKIKKDEAEVQIHNILKRVGLWEARDKKAKNYSKGMVQRLAIAQSLLGSPDLLILDEPASGLDAVGRVKMLTLIKELKEDGKTIILNSHILDDVQRVADRGIIISQGKLIKEWDVETECNNESLETIFIETLEANDQINY